MDTWEYCSLEWQWGGGGMRHNTADGKESRTKGSYAEVVKTLNTLGAQGWEVAGCAAMTNWIYWTLKRRK